MHGARKLALDFVLQHVGAGRDVLDLGAGDGEIGKAMRAAGARVTSVDLSIDRGCEPLDATDVPWRRISGKYDTVVACYTLQHLLGDESAVWREIRRSLKPDGTLVVTGRYKEEAPSFEMERGDPLRQDNEGSLITLAQASGLRLTWIKTYSYNEKGYVASTNRQSANAFAATFMKAGTYGLSWEEAVKRYRLLDVEGWMHEDELRYLYETARFLGGGTVVEVGSFMGRSTCAILAGLAEGRGGRLVVVDKFTGENGSREAEVKKSGGAEWLKGKMLANVKSRGLPTPFVYQGDSKKVFEKFGPGSAEWIFVDGDHTYDGVYEDLRCWVQNTRRGGLLTGHDYHESWPDVVRAVDDYFKAANFAVDVVPGTTIWRVQT